MKHILTDLMRNTKTVMQVMLDEQEVETLEAVQRAVTAGASLRLETTYAPEVAVPSVVLVLISASGERQAITQFDFRSESVQ